VTDNAFLLQFFKVTTLHASYMDEVQRSLHVLFEGRRLLKVSNPFFPLS
jgi:hypothetical protein